jgi:hypothetical protein
MTRSHPTTPRRGRTALRLLAVLAIAITGVGCESLIVTQKSVQDLIARPGFSWEIHPRDAIVTYVEPGSAAAGNVSTIAEDAARAKREVLTYLGEDVYEPTISVFVVDSRQRMKDLTGRATQGTGFYSSNSICIVWTGRIRTTHEMLHIIAMNVWGVPARWVNEGAAVDAAGPWLDEDVHAVSKVLLARGKLPTLDGITRRFNDLPTRISYPAAGSFVRYLRETYGRDALRRVWQRGRRELPRVTGMSVAELEAAWLDVVRAADAEGVEYEL